MELENQLKNSPFKISNIRLYIAFSLFFNSRFYYPVFTIMYLDYGLSISQFAVLNAVWAAAIVAAEVPSGALADVFGRRRMIVFAGLLMIIELSLIAFVPRGNPNILFAVFLVNRILSGLAEASASGADEALAYDSLKKEGLETEWGKVLDAKTRFQSIGFIVTMITGAAVYDPVLIQKLLAFSGYSIKITQDMTLRIPLFMTLFMGCGALYSAIKMSDPETACRDGFRREISLKSAFAVTFKAGMWILRTPFALIVIATGLVFDGVIRMVITLASQYYRIINLPEASFGIIGALISLLGFIIPRIAFKMTKSKTALFNFFSMAVITATGLTGMSFFIPHFGLAFAFVLFSGMYMNYFFISHYLNKITDSKHRATVLSFKGMFYNISYGMIGIAYSLLISYSKKSMDASGIKTDSQLIENRIFVETFGWFPAGFVIAVIILAIFSFIVMKKSSIPDSDKGKKTFLKKD